MMPSPYLDLPDLPVIDQDHLIVGYTVHEPTDNDPTTCVVVHLSLSPDDTRIVTSRTFDSRHRHDKPDILAGVVDISVGLALAAQHFERVGDEDDTPRGVDRSVELAVDPSGCTRLFHRMYVRQQSAS